MATGEAGQQGVDPKRIVALFFIGAAIFAGLFLEKILGIVFAYARLNDSTVFGEGWTVTTLIGFGAALGGAIFAWRNQRVQGVALEIAAELKKVTWPTFRETRAATIAVVVATFAAAIMLGVFDFVWARLSEMIY
jgi:preprotein translocase subunit SecE